MRHTISELGEMLLGIIIFGLGLLYLTSQELTTERLINAANERALEEGGLYQQCNEIVTGLVPGKELYAVIMGYREYPITIDGEVIPPDGIDFERYFGLLKSGSYIKRYVYDTQHVLIRIDFNHSGV